MPISALVVEDDDLTRVSMVAALTAADISVVGHSALSSEGIDLAKKYLPQVALLDVHLGRGPTGVDLAHELRKHDPRIGIVFLTSFEDPRLISETRPLPQGSQYLLKKDVSQIDTITAAIHASLEGKNRRSPSELRGSLSKLSDVQLETLRLVASGLSNAEIAKRRKVTEKSVEASIARLFKALHIEKTHSSNQRVVLARMYFESQGLTPND